MILAAAPAPRGEVVRAGDPQCFRQLPSGFKGLQVVDPLQDDTRLYVVACGPFHHRLIPHSDDFHDVWVLLGQLYRPGDFCGIPLAFLLVVRGQFCPGIFAVDPGTQHHVHFKCRLFCFQLPDGFQQIGGLVIVDVVGAQQLDAHGREYLHVLLQLGDGGLYLSAKLAVATVGDGPVLGIA